MSTESVVAGSASEPGDAFAADAASYVGPIRNPTETDDTYQIRLKNDFQFVYSLPAAEREALLRARERTTQRVAILVGSTGSGKGPAPAAAAPAASPAKSEEEEEKGEEDFTKHWAPLVAYDHSLSHFDNLLRLVKHGCLAVRAAEYKEHSIRVREQNTAVFFEVYKLVEDEVVCLPAEADAAIFAPIVEQMRVIGDKLNARAALKAAGGVLCSTCQSDYCVPTPDDDPYCESCQAIFHHTSLGQKTPFTDPSGCFVWANKVHNPVLEIYAALVLAGAGLVEWSPTSFTPDEKKVFDTIIGKFTPPPHNLNFAKRFARSLWRRRFTGWRSISNDKRGFPSYGYLFHGLSDAITAAETS
jgi:hypothetical protein